MYATPFINKLYAQNNPNPFPELMRVEYSERYHDTAFYKPNLLFVVPVADNEFLVNLAFIGVTPEKESLLRLSYSVIAKEENQHFVLDNSGLTTCLQYIILSTA